MYTTFHIKSAEEINSELLDAIKATFKSKPITIIVEEDESYAEISDDMKIILDERLKEDEKTFLTADESVNELQKKYGL